MDAEMKQARTQPGLGRFLSTKGRDGEEQREKDSGKEKTK